MRVVFTPLARRDLEAIGEYIAQDDVGQALAFVQTLREKCASIILAPHAYRLRPELSPGIRSCPFGNYVIFFVVEETRVILVRILHGAMDIFRHFEIDGSD